MKNNVEAVNPNAQIIEGISEVITEQGGKIKGKKVLVIEDGPTVTHGSMAYGAGTVGANQYHPKEIVDPRPFATGSIIDTFDKYTHLEKVLPAMGYGKKQMKELEQTINNADVDLIVSGTPIDLSRVLHTDTPLIRVRYGVGDNTAKELEGIIDSFIKTHLK